jgi:site-specific DNA-methyltransferase (adenine-specific)
MTALAEQGEQFDSIVTDPPYELGFMGKRWDGTGIAFAVRTWEPALRVLKPGGHLIAFSGTRTYHRMTCAIEDAGFEVRDMIQWIYGSGFPKNHDFARDVDHSNEVGFRIPHAEFGDGPFAEGWGTALKPANEPICMARKPLIGTVAENVFEHGTGAINIDGCRVPVEASEVAEDDGRRVSTSCNDGYQRPNASMFNTGKPAVRNGPANAEGRWPANVIHDGSDEVISAFPTTTSGGVPTPGKRDGNVYGEFADRSMTNHGPSTGSAARFFYCAKASKRDRAGSKHPTVKPIALMRYLCRLVTPPGGSILDPFAGSGTTGKAALEEGFVPTLIEREAEYVADIKKRLKEMHGPLFEDAAAE